MKKVEYLILGHVVTNDVQPHWKDDLKIDKQMTNNHMCISFFLTGIRLLSRPILAPITFCVEQPGVLYIRTNFCPDMIPSGI